MRGFNTRLKAIEAQLTNLLDADPSESNGLPTDGIGYGEGLVYDTSTSAWVTTALIAGSFRGPYQSGRNYHYGDIITNGGAIYVSHDEFTSTNLGADVFGESSPLILVGPVAVGEKPEINPATVTLADIAYLLINAGLATQAA